MAARLWRWEYGSCDEAQPSRWDELHLYATDPQLKLRAIFGRALGASGRRAQSLEAFQP